MDTLSAFARGQASGANEMKCFDWDKAARLIREHQPVIASAGLASDWEWTGGTIYENGEPDVDSYTFLASTWATPELSMDGDVCDCYIMESNVPTDWGKNPSNTKWPASSLKILKGETND